MGMSCSGAGWGVPKGEDRVTMSGILCDSLPLSHFTECCSRYHLGFSHGSALISWGTQDPLLCPSGSHGQVQPPRWCFQNFPEIRHKEHLAQLLWKALRTTIGPSNSTHRGAPRGIPSRDRYLPTCGHSAIIHNHQEVEITQASPSRWTQRQNVECLCNGIVFSLN